LWTTICCISGSGLSPGHCQPFCLSRLCLLKVHLEINSLPLLPPLVCLDTPPPHLCCVFLFISLFIIQFFFAVQGSVCPGGNGGLSQGWLWEIPCAAYLLTCWSVSPKQVWSQCLVAWEPSCNVAWSSFVWAGGSGCRSPDSSWCFFFCQVWLQPASQQGFCFTELTLSASAPLSTSWILLSAFSSGETFTLVKISLYC
jgi:hypothetical protein